MTTYHGTPNTNSNIGLLKQPKTGKMPASVKQKSKLLGKSMENNVGAERGEEELPDCELNDDEAQDAVDIDPQMDCATPNDDDFAEIPELPTGQCLRFELLSPWDDPQFVGLGGIEVFTAQGTRPAVLEAWTNAVECSGDLRVLVEGQAHGCDPGHMWLCNYRQLPPDYAEPIHISFRFGEPQTLAMIRIWNYAGSRVHALRGVRNLRIWLDQLCIFRGEICCAFVGGIGHGEAPQGDTILFTTNDDILAKIAEHDEEMLQAENEAKPDETMPDEKPQELMPDQQLALLALQQTGGETAAENLLPRLTASNRPTTGHTSNGSASSSTSSTAAGRAPKEVHVEKAAESEGKSAVEKEEKENDDVQEDEEDENICVGKVFHIELLANWGSPDSIGLTGIQFLGPKFEPINDVLARECVVRCEPAEHDGAGQLGNLLNGRNLTCRPEEMWLLKGFGWDPKLQQPQPGNIVPILSFTFPHEVRISGISIWNYNASPELSYAGVRCARFYANGKPINGIGQVLLRKAPGFVFFDFVQDVLFDRCPLVRPLSSRPQTKSVAAFRLLSSWGDEFYIGLNGIELYNRRDQPIRLRPQNLAAFPESVNCLASVHNDPRTSDKLIDGVNDTTKAHHMWLTPILPNSFARVFVIFDQPMFVTRIRIYNYRKTPQRGVRHIAISADDLLLCSGTEVPVSSEGNTGILDIPLRDAE